MWCGRHASIEIFNPLSLVASPNPILCGSISWIWRLCCLPVHFCHSLRSNFSFIMPTSPAIGVEMTFRTAYGVEEHVTIDASTIDKVELPDRHPWKDGEEPPKVSEHKNIPSRRLSWWKIHATLATSWTVASARVQVLVQPLFAKISKLGRRKLAWWISNPVV